MAFVNVVILKEGWCEMFKRGMNKEFMQTLAAQSNTPQVQNRTQPLPRSYGENRNIARGLRQEIANTKAQAGVVDPKLYRNTVKELRSDLADVKSRQSIARSDPSFAARQAELAMLKGASSKSPDTRKQIKELRESISSFRRAGMKDGGEAKASRQGMTQPKSEAEFMFDSSNKDMRKQLKGMSPHVTEPTYESESKAPKKEAVKKAKGGSCYAEGGATRADGCAQRGKTRGRMV